MRLVFLLLVAVLILHTCLTESILNWANQTHLCSGGKWLVVLERDSLPTKTTSKNWIIHVFCLATQTLL